MQLTYTQYNDELQLGNIADTSLRQVDTMLAQGAVGLAKAVVFGTDKETSTKRAQCVQAGTGAGQGALIVGIAILSQTLEQNSSGVVQYADKDAVPVMRKGRVVVAVDSAVVAGALANFILATGNFDDTAVTTGVEATPALKARFVTGTTGAGLAVLEIHNTN